MTPSRNSSENHCCGIQKKRVKKDIRSCREAYDDPQARHACYRAVSKSSKHEAVACMSGQPG